MASYISCCTVPITLMAICILLLLWAGLTSLFFYMLLEACFCHDLFGTRMEVQLPPEEQDQLPLPLWLGVSLRSVCQSVSSPADIKTRTSVALWAPEADWRKCLTLSCLSKKTFSFSFRLSFNSSH